MNSKDAERTSRQRAEENFAGVKSQWLKDLALNKSDWEVSLNEVKARQRESVMEISQLKQSLSIALEENTRLKDKARSDFNQYQHSSTLISKAEREKHESIVSALKGTMSGEIERLNANLQRVNEEVSSCRLQVSLKDEQLNSITTSFQSVSTREAVAQKEIEHLNIKIKSLQDSIWASQHTIEQLQRSEREKSAKEMEYLATISHCQDEVQSLRSEFTPLISRYTRTIAEIRDKHERVRRELVKEIEEVNLECTRLNVENKALTRSLRDRNEVLIALEQRLAHLSM